MTRTSQRPTTANEKRALADALLRSAAQGEPLHPLSFAEERLWFLEQLAPGNTAYNYFFASRLRGTLDVDALARALGLVLHRHEALRSRFRYVVGRPLRTIAPPAPLELAVETITAADETAIIRRATAEARRPFDLERGPLLRATLLAIGPEDHVALICLHHIVFDGWSLGIFLREVVTAYGALVEQLPVDLPPLPLRYLDFVRAQRQAGLADRLAGGLAYWRAQFTPPPPFLALPTDRPRPAVQSHRGARRRARVPADAIGPLRSLAQKEGSTLFMTLLTAFAIVLQHRTGQDDLTIGTDAANRPRADVEGLIGLFVNQLALRVRIDGDPGFRTLLGSVTRTCADAYAHQDVPFDAVVAAVQPNRDPSRSPLFQVKLVLQNLPAQRIEMAGLEWALLDVDPGTAKFDLLVNLVESDGGIDGEFEYCTDLFAPDTVAALADDLTAVARHVGTQPDAPVSDLRAALARRALERRRAGEDRARATRQHRLAALADGSRTSRRADAV